MPSLKLSMLSSVYALPYKWARTITTTTTTTTTTSSAAVTRARIQGRSVVLNISHQGIIQAAWRIKPCAPLILPAHDKAPYRKLGFRGQNSFYSSEDRGVGSGGVMTDMGSENNGDQWPPEENHNHHHHRQPPPQESTKLLTLPTVLTISRVAAVPLLVGTFYVNSWWGTTATTSIFIAAAITDWLDGYIARKMRLGSAFGAFLDPVADKLMVAATLVLLCTRPFEVPMFGQVPWLLTVPAIAIIGREITMSAVREWAASQNGKLSEAVAVNNLGKWKTATQMTALTILLATRDSSLTGTGTLVASGVVLLYISAWLAVWSLVVYMRKIWKVLLK
ncbi:CDP-diacylglycerol--glycerol-3-phosphate 3-phosphatidyltransferase 2-like [Camellia sinensis]|uniref:CDP-diacylglycerol--glycerol-3-phosphate 3-phosphatidyltransferase 2-like n=1 Tax=Camellia sinensis TaxID=4442 RepID=UPI001035CA1A|nr:CDP-diacylglycerol--glycerol-3-phosphate 3-phosphatidyltransferase 2-like [Camellia sinensis]